MDGCSDPVSGVVEQVSLCNRRTGVGGFGWLIPVRYHYERKEMKTLNQARHEELMERMKLLPIFRCGYCSMPHPTRYCPNLDDAGDLTTGPYPEDGRTQSDYEAFGG